MKTILVPVEEHSLIHPVLETALCSSAGSTKLHRGGPRQHQSPRGAAGRHRNRGAVGPRSEHPPGDGGRVPQAFRDLHASPKACHGRAGRARARASAGIAGELMDDNVPRQLWPDLRSDRRRPARFGREPPAAVDGGGRPVREWPTDPHRAADDAAEPRRDRRHCLERQHGNRPHGGRCRCPCSLRARRVVVLTLEDWGGADRAEKSSRDTLRRHGMPVEATHIANTSGRYGETILSNAAALGCDLLIKGAYTQSRLRQMILGGATSHILAHTTLPVFMAH